MLPPPPPPLSFRATTTGDRSTPQAPAVSQSGPAGGLLLELIKHNGAPFNDHWAYFVRSSSSASVGIVYEAVGDVRSGFQRQVQRNHDLASDPPSSRIPLQWVDATFVEEELMLHGKESIPMCAFEESLHKVKVPEKTLNNTRESVRTEPQAVTIRRSRMNDSLKHLLCIGGPQEENRTKKLPDMDRRVSGSTGHRWHSLPRCRCLSPCHEASLNICQRPILEIVRSPILSSVSPSDVARRKFEGYFKTLQDMAADNLIATGWLTPAADGGPGMADVMLAATVRHTELSWSEFILEDEGLRRLRERYERFKTVGFWHELEETGRFPDNAKRGEGSVQK